MSTSSASRHVGESESTRMVESLEDCARSYRALIAYLVETGPNELWMSELWDRWSAHYFGPFSRFDTDLRDAARTGLARYGGYLPVSISTHNLHRLVQALRADVGDGRLADAAIPERVEDLFAVCRRLAELVATTATGPARSTPPSP